MSATMGNSIVKIKPQRFRSETHKATNVSRQKLAGPSVATRGTTPGVHNVAPDCTRHDNILTVTSVNSPLVSRSWWPAEKNDGSKKPHQQ